MNQFILKPESPLSDSEKIALLMEALVICLNSLELAKKNELPPHIARAAWTMVNETFERIK